MASHRNIEKEQRAAKFVADKKALKYTLDDLIEQVKTSNYYLIVISITLLVLLFLIGWKL